MLSSIETGSFPGYLVVCEPAEMLVLAGAIDEAVKNTPSDSHDRVVAEELRREVGLKAYNGYSVRLDSGEVKPTVNPAPHLRIGPAQLDLVIDTTLSVAVSGSGLRGYRRRRRAYRMYEEAREEQGRFERTLNRD